MNSKDTLADMKHKITPRQQGVIEVKTIF